MQYNREQYQAYLATARRVYSDKVKPMAVLEEGFKTLTCVWHPDEEAVGEFVMKEEGFTEYDPFCQECLDGHIADGHKLFTDLINGTHKQDDMGYFCCDNCNVELPYLRKVDEETIERTLHDYRDPEDGSRKDLCGDCYSKQRKKDADYWEE